MEQYLSLLEKIYTEGTNSKDRTGTGTKSIFSESLKFDLDEGFPLVTTKFINYDAVLHELLWFISGSTNINTLKSKIWNEWATKEGDIGPMYGYQWRHWKGKLYENEGYFDHDQLANVIFNIKEFPYSRRHIVSAWNVGYLPREVIPPQANVYNGDMALAPCHHFFQFYVRNGELNLHFSMRSTDAFLGLPFNIASYATLLIMVAQLTNLKPKILSYHGVDIHLYNNHLEQVEKQLTRTPYIKPDLVVTPRSDIDTYCFEDFELIDYKHHDKLYGKISV